MKQIIRYISLLLVSSLAIAKSTTCPDLSELDHPDPQTMGYEIAPMSKINSTAGSHQFHYVKMGTQKVLGVTWVACAYSKGDLILIKHGKFNHKYWDDKWYNAHYLHEQCDEGLEECQFNEFVN